MKFLPRPRNSSLSSYLKPQGDLDQLIANPLTHGFIKVSEMIDLILKEVEKAREDWEDWAKKQPLSELGTYSDTPNSRLNFYWKYVPSPQHQANQTITTPDQARLLHTVMKKILPATSKGSVSGKKVMAYIALLKTARDAAEGYLETDAWRQAYAAHFSQYPNPDLPPAVAGAKKAVKPPSVKPVDPIYHLGSQATALQRGAGGSQPTKKAPRSTPSLLPAPKPQPPKATKGELAQPPPPAGPWSMPAPVPGFLQSVRDQFLMPSLMVDALQLDLGLRVHKNDRMGSADAMRKSYAETSLALNKSRDAWQKLAYARSQTSAFEVKAAEAKASLLKVKARLDKAAEEAAAADKLLEPYMNAPGDSTQVVQQQWEERLQRSTLPRQEEQLEEMVWTYEGLEGAIKPRDLKEKGASLRNKVWDKVKDRLKEQGNFLPPPPPPLA